MPTEKGIKKAIMESYGELTYFPNTKMWIIRSDNGGVFHMYYQSMESLYHDVRMLMWDRVRKIGRGQ